MGHDNSVLGLASIRHNRGLSLEQISHSTKISLRALQAIEEGQFKKLPGGIYHHRIRNDAHFFRGRRAQDGQVSLIEPNFAPDLCRRPVGIHLER